MPFLRRLMTAITLFFWISVTTAEQPPELFVLPKQGVRELLQAINHADHHIDLVMYTFSYKPLLKALTRAKERGVDVKVILEKQPYANVDFNRGTRKQLEEAGIPVRGGYDKFNFTHQKTLVVDGDKAFISTGNFTYSGLKQQRNFMVETHDRQQISQILYVFNKDFWNQRAGELFPSALVWSPDNSREKLLDLINGAQHDLLIYASGLSDPALIQAIEQDEARTVAVSILMSKPDDDDAEKADDQQAIIKDLRAHGVKVYLDHGRLYIHAKTIVRDEDESDRAAYVGSINFTSNSIDANRELGIILDDESIVHALAFKFHRDIRS